MPLERDIQRAIFDALKKIPHVKVERNNRGSKGHIRFGLGDGAADLVGVVSVRVRNEVPTGQHGSAWENVDLGRFFALEIKRPGKEMEPHQLKWAEGVRALGGYVGCAHSVKEALEHVEKARRL